MKGKKKVDIMARRALLKFCPLEYLYLDTYGRMPDYDTDHLIACGMAPCDASKLVYERLDELWEKMKHDHAHEEERIRTQLEKECPF